MVQMNLLTKQKQTHGCRKQSYKGWGQVKEDKIVQRAIFNSLYGERI